jgi:DNA-binding GntR family transcriptional regulator
MVKKIGLYGWSGDLNLIMKALANRTKSSNLTKLAQRYNMSVPAITKHTDILVRAKLANRMHGVGSVMIEAVPGRLLVVKKYLDSYKEFWEEVDRQIPRTKVLE